jgi:hypothetical protein
LPQRRSHKARVRALLRLLFLLPVFAALALSVGVFEAVSKTDAAFDSIRASRSMQGTPLQTRILADAAAAIEQSWAKPRLWHARAAEALSAIYALQAEAAGDAPDISAKSIDAGTQAVSLAPVQPQSWARLATFAQAGAPNVGCAVAECLDRSWRAAPFSGFVTDCARLRLGYAAGLPSASLHPRTIWFVRAGHGNDNIAQCLSFLPREQVFQYLLEAQSPATPDSSLPR